MVERVNLWQCLELGTKIVSMPTCAASEALLGIEVGSCVSATESSVALAALGLQGWTYTGMTDHGDWCHMKFENPCAPIPLALFHMKASFDLPGGDGGVNAVLGFITTDLKYVLTHRSLTEYPVRRRLLTSSYESWLE
eukprot:1048560-Amphidinium_carterae.1